MPWRFNPFTGNLDETDIPAFNGEVTLGSAASPSIFFTGDPNTGIYSPGADQLALSTNGAGRLFVSSLGRIGVGVVSPNALLHAGLTGNAGAPATGTVALFENNTSGSNCYIQINGAFDAESGVVFTDGSQANKGRILYNNATEHMVLWTDGSERLRITSAGLVGIGNSSPSYTLDVEGQTRVSTRLRIDGPSSGDKLKLSGITTGAIYADITNTGNTTIIGNEQSTGGALCSGGLAYATVINAQSARPLQLATSNTARLTISSTGSVGIGTTSPGALLHLSSTNEASLLVKNTASSGPNAPQLQLQNDAGHGFNIEVGRSGVGGHTAINYSAANTTSNYLAFTNDAGEVLRLDGSSRLLVGTSSSSATGTAVIQADRTQVIGRSATNVAASSTASIVLSTSAGLYHGFLSVSVVDSANASVSTSTTYSIFGRGATSSIQQIATNNGTGGARAFSVATPASMTIEVTNNAASNSNVYISFFGSLAA